MDQKGELLEVIDLQGRVLRLARRKECHSDPALMHRVAHVLVFDSQGRLFLQKRGQDKDIQPGKWDTSVGGHLCPGESEETGAQRELGEELGIFGATLEFLYQYIMYSPVETEKVTTYKTIWNSRIRPQAGEIETGRFWEETEIEASLGTGVFTPNFEDEYSRWKKVRPGKGASG
ncbi:NUDIX domain-containing protein [candidate division FCPU426 bacterium]|nr:NUDIX domain-containing protein [candidate division FCPU426 bacterium]